MLMSTALCPTSLLEDSPAHQLSIGGNKPHPEPAPCARSLLLILQFWNAIADLL